MMHAALEIMVGFAEIEGAVALCGEITKDIVCAKFEDVRGATGFQNWYDITECEACRKRMKEMMDELHKLMQEHGDEEP